MYVTRPLSLYRNSPSALSLPPPEGPSSGILVIKDEAAESKWLFGMLKDETVSVPPFPQNKKLWLSNTMVVGTNTFVDYIYALFIPVLDQPLSSNQYYIIKSQGSEKGYLSPPLFSLLSIVLPNFRPPIWAFFAMNRILSTMV